MNPIHGRTANEWLAWPLARLVRLYQVAVSPLLPPACRFYPTCSQYALDALAGYGALRGLWMTAWRLLKCHPLHPGGYDPVPPRVSADNPPAR